MRHTAVAGADRFRGEEYAAITCLARKFNKRPAIADPDLTPVIKTRVVVIEALAKSTVGTFPLLEDRTVPQDRLDTAGAGELAVLCDNPLTDPEVERSVRIGRPLVQGDPTLSLTAYLSRLQKVAHFAEPTGQPRMGLNNPSAEG